jgi:polysaccharide pyruvyl transferase WcaK-like protein
MASASPAFSIIAATAYGNRGAEAMLETVVGRLRSEVPAAIFHVFTYYPAEDRRLISDPRIALHSSTPAALVFRLFPASILFALLRAVFGSRVLRFAPADVRALADSRALVDLAGVSFIDGRERFLPFNTLTLLPAWLLRTPVVKMPQAMGPFRNPLNRLLAGFVLPKCRVLWARGAQTKSHLETAPFRIVAGQADDIAFNHRSAYSLTDEGAAEVTKVLEDVDQRRGDACGVIGICPSSVVAVQSAKSGGRYEPVLVELIRALAQRGFLVVLFPNATRAIDAEAQRNNDLPLLRRLRDAVGGLPAEQRLIVLDSDVNATGIKRTIAAMDAVLVSRFHAMVGALSLGIPASVLGWSHKYVEVMERFGLGANVIDYKAIDCGDLLQRVCDVFGRRAEIRGAIEARLPEVQASADRPVAALLSDTLGADLA